MKYIVLLSFCSLVLSILAAACSSDAHDEKYRQVVMRDIGNKILWSLGDSVSRVMPVASKGGAYTISFERPASVSYDSVVAVVSQELIKNGITRFVAEMKDCRTNEVLLAFAFRSPSDSLTPCTGRHTEPGCFTIEITPGREHRTLRAALPFIISGAVGGLLFLYFKSRSGRKHKTAPAKGQGLPVGKYTFDPTEKTLTIDDLILPLTDKEAKLLSLLLSNMNQTLSRETLMAEIWGEDGLMVIARNIDVLVSKLRKKLMHDDSLAITNVHGVGYKLVDVTAKG
ncbi:MAG TPA: winged helix-turn-helix domain-containing protein [Saprospiraceae bacterium]|nr:winged helix-turn-helix domain-containing protein [Saprospiraceae bacterium]HRK82352.1 winged helix-turn-helix domain-containing protein [Saprospiraceae bacterium]